VIDFFKEHEYEAGRSTEDKVVLGSIAVGGGLILIGILIYTMLNPQLGGALLLLGLIVGVLPYGVVSFLKNRAIREMEDQFPSFLADLAESKRRGMTLLQSFEAGKDTDYGRMHSEIKRVHNELTWGIPFPEVMERFSKRMADSPVIQESVSILLQSFQSGGNITKTIESIAEDASQLKETIQKKNSKIKQQIFIMYIIYFLFIGITIGIYTMLGELLGLGKAGQGALQGLEFMGESSSINYCGGSVSAAQPLCETAKLFGFVPQNVTSFTSAYAVQFNYGNMAYYKSLLFTMLMVQGVMAGAVAGQIGEGSPSAGVKHALIMLPIAFIVFMYAVGLAGV
jgi:flagellar protein FlaJ